MPRAAKRPKPNRPVTPQAQMICNAWAEIMQAQLSPGHVTEHLAMLDEWERAKMKDLGKKISRCGVEGHAATVLTVSQPSGLKGRVSTGSYNNQTNERHGATPWISGDDDAPLAAGIEPGHRE